MQANTFFDDIGNSAFSDLGVIPQSKPPSIIQNKKEIILPAELTEKEITFVSTEPLVELVESICMNDGIVDKDEMIHSAITRNIRVTSEEYIKVMVICLANKFVKCYTYLYPTVNKTGLYIKLSSIITPENCILLNALFDLDPTLELPFSLVHVILKTKIYSKLPKFTDIFRNSLYLIEDVVKVVLLSISFAYDIPDISIQIMDDMLTKLSEHCLIDVYMPAFLRNKDDKNKDIILYLIACSNKLLPEGTTNFEEFEDYVLHPQGMSLQEYKEYTKVLCEIGNPKSIQNLRDQLMQREHYLSNQSNHRNGFCDPSYITVSDTNRIFLRNYIENYIDSASPLKQLSFKENLENLTMYYNVYDKKYKYNCWLRLRCMTCNSKASYELKCNKFIHNEEFNLCSTYPTITNINLTPFNTFDAQDTDPIFKMRAMGKYKCIRRGKDETADRDVPIEHMKELHAILSKVEYTETKTKCILLDCGHINPIDTLLDTYYYDLFNVNL